MTSLSDEKRFEQMIDGAMSCLDVCQTVELVGQFSLRERVRMKEWST